MLTKLLEIELIIYIKKKDWYAIKPNQQTNQPTTNVIWRKQENEEEKKKVEG